MHFIHGYMDSLDTNLAVPIVHASMLDEHSSEIQTHRDVSREEAAWMAEAEE